jgi:hypothetical protein
MRTPNSNVWYNTLIGCKKVAIYWYDVLIKAGYSHINFNQINWGEPDTSLEGVRVENNIVFQTNVTVVYNNISNVHYGVHLRNTYQLDASSDSIEFPQTFNTSSEYIGMLLDGGSYNTINNNYIFAHSVPSSGLENVLRGFSLNKSENNTLRENTMEKLGVGLRANGNTVQTYLYCNLFDSCWNSIRHENVGKLGTIGGTIDPWDNVFHANRDTFKVDQDFSVNPPSLWYYRDSTLSTNDYSPFPWNAFIVNPNPYQKADLKCEGRDTSGGGGGTGHGRAMAMTQVLQDSVNYDDLVEENVHFDKNAVYQTLDEQPELMSLGDSTDVPLSSFYSDEENSNFDLLNQVRKYLEENEQQDASSLNAQIIPLNIMEEYSVVVNQIYMDATSSDTLSLDSTQISSLWPIAILNPMIGGEAVYRARAMLRVDILDGINSQLRRGSSTTDSNLLSEINVKIYPNPTKDVFTVEIADHETPNLFLQLIDALNRVVFEKEVKTRQLNISTVDLPTGVYNVRVSSSNSKVDKKLIVIR